MVSITQFQDHLPSDLSLTLCFFGAYLLRLGTIQSASTVRGYIGHVKNLWIEEGCHPDDLNSVTLSRFLKGVARLLPKSPDKRPPFLLTFYPIPLMYWYPPNSGRCAEFSAVILGFFAMLRFHIFKKLTLKI